MFNITYFKMICNSKKSNSKLEFYRDDSTFHVDIKTSWESLSYRNEFLHYIQNDRPSEMNILNLLDKKLVFHVYCTFVSKIQ